MNRSSRPSVEKILSAYAEHPLSRQAILDRVKEWLPENAPLTEFDLAIDPERNITDQNHVGGALSTLQLAGLVRISSSDHVLDLGCGLGGPARLLALVFNCHVQGIDLSPTRIEDAISLTDLVHLSAMARFRCADISGLSPSRKFDVVWGQNAWLHIGEPFLMAGIAARALVPGGRLAFEDAFLRRIPTTSEEVALLQELCEVWQCTLLPPSEWILGFKVAGFEINVTQCADDLFNDYFARSSLQDIAAWRPNFAQEAIGHRNALALGKAGVVGYGRVVATLGRDLPITVQSKASGTNPNLRT